MKYLAEKYPQIARIRIQDETLLINNQRAVEFCDEVVKHGITTKFICQARMKPLSKDIVTKLEQANFQKILFGLESGNDEILKAAHKGITKNDAINAFELFADSPIQIAIFLIVGLPGETLETIKETANLVQQLQKIKYSHCQGAGILTIFPGTEIYHLTKSKKLIDDDFWLRDEPTPIFTGEHSAEQLYEFKKKLLDHISLNRIFTLNGLKAQFKMLPQIIKFLLFDLKTAKVTSEK